MGIIALRRGSMIASRTVNQTALIFAWRAYERIAFFSVSVDVACSAVLDDRGVCAVALRGVVACRLICGPLRNDDVVGCVVVCDAGAFVFERVLLRDAGVWRSPSRTTLE